MRRDGDGGLALGVLAQHHLDRRPRRNLRVGHAVALAIEHRLAGLGAAGAEPDKVLAARHSRGVKAQPSRQRRLQVVALTSALP